MGACGKGTSRPKKQIDQNHSKLNSDLITIRTGCVAEDCLESLIHFYLLSVEMADTGRHTWSLWCWGANPGFVYVR